MSLSYGFIASTNNDNYKHKSSTVSPKPATNILRLLDESNNAPPSYSFVLAEKYQQQQCTTWGKRIEDEINTLLQTMRSSMQETEILLISYQHCCQRLEIKNQYILKRLQSVIESSASDIDTTAFDDPLNQSEQAYQQDANDSISRMNASLEKLIQEAESSLQTRLSLHDEPAFTLRKSRSLPQFTKSTITKNSRRKSGFDKDPSANTEYNDAELNLQKQKNRYIYSEWKLAIAMKELLHTVEQQQQSHNIINDQQVHHYHHYTHHHHYHHHVYHHMDNTMPLTIKEEEVMNKESTFIAGERPKMLRSASSLTSLFKYAMDTVGGFIRQQRQQQEQQPLGKSSTLSKTVKYRTIFLTSLLILQRYNKRHLWVQRGQRLIHAWKSRRFHLYTRWVEKAHLLHFMLQIFASSSPSPSNRLLL